MKAMFSTSVALLAAVVLTASAGEIRTDWLYHAGAGLDPASLPVPGTTSTFLVPPSGPSGSAAVYVLTPTQFADDASEQVFVRWWDGRMAHWIMGVWMRNLTAADLPADAPYARNLPDDAVLDLWKVEIPSWIPQPGENYYAVQLKATSAGGSSERYLLASGGGDFSHTNALGQIWSASEEFDGQDWPVHIGERP